MPNWIKNEVRISGDSKRIEELAAFMKTGSGNDENVFSFEKIEPTPAELLAGDGWYAWRIEHWGTKWNSAEAYRTAYGYDFETAWSTPLEAMMKLGAMFPDLTFEVKFADEDLGYNCGEYTIHGEYMYDYSPEGGTDEAYDLAFEMWGQPDYYERDEDGHWRYVDDED